LLEFDGAGKQLRQRDFWRIPDSTPDPIMDEDGLAAILEDALRLQAALDSPHEPTFDGLSAYYMSRAYALFHELQRSVPANSDSRLTHRRAARTPELALRVAQHQ
jgi:hypothetical protein